MTTMYRHWDRNPAEEEVEVATMEDTVEAVAEAEAEAEEDIMAEVVDVDVVEEDEEELGV
jgi:hypothetical protein